MWGMIYNTKYNCIMCTKCEAALPFNGFVNHAYKGAIIGFNWDRHSRTYKTMPAEKHNYPKITKPTKRPRPPGTKPQALSNDKIEAIILDELKLALGYVANPLTHGALSTENREAWIKQALPHADQVGPVEGLAVYEHGIQCLNGSCSTADFPYIGLVLESTKAHVRAQHSHIEASDAMFQFDIPSQTFCLKKGYTFLFRVPGKAVPAVIPENKAKKALSLEEAVANARKELLGGVTGKEAVAHELIHPAYENFTPFWEALDMETVKPLLKLRPITYKKMPKETKLLRDAVLSTFIETASYVKHANPALRHLIVKGAA